MTPRDPQPAPELEPGQPDTTTAPTAKPNAAALFSAAYQLPPATLLTLLGYLEYTDANYDPDHPVGLSEWIKDERLHRNGPLMLAARGELLLQQLPADASDEVLTWMTAAFAACHLSPPT